VPWQLSLQGISGKNRAVSMLARTRHFVTPHFFACCCHGCSCYHHEHRVAVATQQQVFVDYWRSEIERLLTPTGSSEPGFVTAPGGRIILIFGASDIGFHRKK